MRYVKKSNTYKASNFEFNVNECYSWSYDWWLFSSLETVKGKNIIFFNHTRYSNSTSKHQNKALALIGKHYDSTIFHINHSRENMNDGIVSVLEDAANNTLGTIQNMLKDTLKKGTRKTTNIYRMEKAEYLVSEYNRYVSMINDLTNSNIDLLSNIYPYTDLSLKLYPNNINICNHYIIAYR